LHRKRKLSQNILRNNLGATLPDLPPLTGHPWDNHQQDLSILEAPFSQDEIKETIDSMPGDKATGPDGFHWCLLQTLLGNHQI